MFLLRHDVLRFTTRRVVQQLDRWRIWLFLDLPMTVRPDEFRFSVYLNFLLVFSWIAHAFFIPVFACLDVQPLVLYNAGSVILFCVAWLLNRRGLHYLAMLLAATEFVGHAWLSVRLVGWEFGFQYYIMGWSWVPFLAPPGRKLAKVGVALTGGLCFFFLTTYAAVKVFPPGSRQLAMAPYINAINLTIFCGGLAVCFFTFRKLVDSAEQLARDAHSRSERLLHNILPVQVAEQLKHRTGVVADTHAGATVLFLDIVNFTPLTDKMPPAEMVNLLNAIFGRLDGLAAKYQIEKIKTVGDAYMVAAGVPTVRTDHAEVIGFFALDALGVIHGFTGNDGKPMQVRIGIDTGSAVAGVIGRHKFVYDLWGDMVNTASRMESHGLPDRIQTSRRYYEQTKETFIFERRGVIEIKGKGPMETFLLVSGRIPPTSQQHSPTKPC